MKLAVTVLAFCVAALLATGLVMLYSSSMDEVGARYLIQQAIWCGLGLVCCLVAAAVDYRHLKKVVWLLYGLAAILLAAVFIPHIGHASHGARRWIGMHGTQNIQPSELAKIVLIIAVAWYGDRYQRHLPTWRKGILIPALFVGFILGLIFIEPDRGTTLLLAAVCGFMLFVAGVRVSYVLPVLLVAGLAMFFSLRHDSMRSGRIHAWLHPEETKLDQGHQTYEAIIAFGAGGWRGVGLGDSRQKLGFVPEDHTDFILPIIGEELGLVATLAVASSFLCIGICGLWIARHAKDTFGLLMATGITMLIGLQAAINIGVVTGALPNKGLPLPFISYGGSNLVALLTGVGLLFSIARFSLEPATEEAKSAAGGQPVLQLT
jgi:cell division protein FtsW